MSDPQNEVSTDGGVDREQIRDDVSGVWMLIKFIVGIAALAGLLVGVPLLLIFWPSIIMPAAGVESETTGFVNVAWWGMVGAYISIRMVVGRYTK